MPSWLPGRGFQRIAKEMRIDLDRLYDVPFDFVTQEMVCDQNLRVSYPL